MRSPELRAKGEGARSSRGPNESPVEAIRLRVGGSDPVIENV